MVHQSLMNIRQRALLGLASVVLLTELAVLTIYADVVASWFAHNWWLVVVPFAKALIKRILAMKLAIIIKAGLVLLWNLGKLFILKIFKTLSVRYGIFFTQNRWYWVRRAKVVFLRRGKQFFRNSGRFWSGFSTKHKWIILFAFFPIVIVLALLGLSFNVTRKTMVQKTQETAVFQMATSASHTSKGIRAWIARIDRRTLDQIRNLTPRARIVQEEIKKDQIR